MARRPWRRFLFLLAVVALMAGSLTSGITTANGDGHPTVGSQAGFAASWQMLWDSDEDLYRTLNGMAATGAKWLRMDIDWPSIQPTHDSWNWRATDRVLYGARERGLQVVGTLAYTPPWARASGTHSKYPPSDHGQFANFAAAAVRRYKDAGVHHWEIWNEPNQSQWWGPQPDPWAYTSLLQHSYRAIKGVDPSATVIGAGLAPAPDAEDGSQINGETFVRRMYRAGAKGYFDALAMHPYNYPVEPMYPHPMNAFASTTPAIHAEMEANGEGWKKVWLTEYGAPTSGYRAVNEEDQAEFLVKAYEQVARWPWAGPLFYYMYRDQSWDTANRDDNFGLRRRDWSWKQGMGAFIDEMNRPLP